ncbi:hypothetical protein SAMN05720764_102242, partial [Fibrobacter sp. UWH5]|uniref:hypothetical protein n=1 Tax=Fibrobacter sp. UWH5 TaxID=1896211 RepID=UPI000912F414
KSIGQRLGFVSAGDERRALERKVRRMESASKAKDAKLADQANALADNAAEIAALKAEIERLKSGK